MQIYLNIVLLATCCSIISMQNLPRGRVRIGDLPQLPNNHRRHPIPHVDNTNLPIGYNPRRRYNNHRSSANSLNENDWFRPTPITTIPAHVSIPLLRETNQNKTSQLEPQIKPRLQPILQFDSNSDLNAAQQVQPGTIIETIVYGQWKPEHPVKPKEISNESHESREEFKQKPRKRIYGHLESMLMGMPMYSHKSAESHNVLQNNEHSQNDNFHNENGNNFGRRKIPTTTTTTTTTTTSTSTTPMPMLPTPKLVSSIDKTDALPEEEVNDSVEFESIEKNQYPEYYEMEDRMSTLHIPNDNTWIPMVPSNSNNDELFKQTSPMMDADTTVKATTMPTTKVRTTTASTTSTAIPMSREVMETTLNLLNWPTDFLIPTTEQPQQPIFKQNSELESKYFEDILNSAQMHSELSIAESLMPQLNSLNITRVGVPYEELNSAEEPTICVPLTVTETSVSSEGEEMIQVERVYCFPLPKVEVKGANNSDQIGRNKPKIRLDDFDIKQSTSGAHSIKGFNLLVTCIIWYVSWHFS